MLKYYDVAETFAEFPDEIALCINLTNCPGMCENCSEPWLREDIGTPLSQTEIDKLISEHEHVSCIGFMGGDGDRIGRLLAAKYIKTNYPKLKVGVYSGMESIDLELLEWVDFYKIGRWINPKGDEQDWHKVNCGPLSFPWSNQLYFEKINGKLINATYKFRKQELHELSRSIIKNELE